MNGLKIDGCSMIYEDALGEKHVLIDGIHTIRNVSRIPLQNFDNNKALIEYLVEIQEQYEVKSRNSQEHTMIPFIMNCIVANYLIETPFSVKALEIGCTTGMVSWNLVNVLRLFHPKSSLCCVSDVIGNGTSDLWLNEVVDVINEFKMSLLVSDYDEMPLESSSFQVVVINGIVPNKSQIDAMQEVFRVLAKDGIMVCDVKGDIMGMETKLYKLVFKYERILINMNEAIYIIRQGDVIIEKENNLSQRYQMICEKAKFFLESEVCQIKERKELNYFVDEVKLAINDAIDRNEIEIKLALIALKRKLIEKYI